MAKITYKNKSSFINLPISDTKEVTARDMNEIKASVNALYDRYKVYTALLSQPDVAGNIVPEVLENTIGTVTFSRYGVGGYLLTLPEQVDLNKIFINNTVADYESTFFIGNVAVLYSQSPQGVLSMFGANEVADKLQSIAIETYVGESTVEFNTLFKRFPLEIRVYP